MNKNKLRAVIVEDETESLNLLQNLLMANGIAEVVACTSDPAEAVNLINSSDPDIVFLDIKMPGKNGFEILDELNKKRIVDPYIVFTTAFDEFAIKAFEYAAFDYLLKPVEPGRLNETLIRCISSVKGTRLMKADVLLGIQKKLIFRNVSGVIFIDPDEVIYIEAEGNYSLFHMSGNRTETVTVLIGKIENLLRSDNFFRISRSFIINLDYLKKVNTRQSLCILVKNGSEFRCSIARDRINDLIDRMKSR